MIRKILKKFGFYQIARINFLHLLPSITSKIFVENGSKFCRKWSEILSKMVQNFV